MVDTDESAYSIIQVYQAKLQVKGYGRESNRSLELR